MSELIIDHDAEIAFHRTACAMVAAAAREQPLTPAESFLGDSARRQVSGAFVTLKREARLRSCYGTYGGHYDLAEALSGAAAGAAKKDPRFPVVDPDELERLHLEVSLLHSIRTITAHGPDRAAAVETGRHGLTIRQGGKSGLPLPRVAVDMQLDAKSFLDLVSGKAGLPTAAWLDDDTHLQTFQARCFGGPFDTAYCK